MSFQLTAVSGVYRCGRVLKQTAIYTGYSGRYSVRIIGPRTEKQHVQLVTNRNTINKLANHYAPNLVPSFDTDGHFRVNVQLPHHSWNITELNAIDWNVIVQELEIGIAAAQEIEQGFAAYFPLNTKG